MPCSITCTRCFWNVGCGGLYNANEPSVQCNALCSFFDEKNSLCWPDGSNGLSIDVREGDSCHFKVTKIVT